MSSGPKKYIVIKIQENRKVLPIVPRAHRTLFSTILMDNFFLSFIFAIKSYNSIILILYINCFLLWVAIFSCTVLFIYFIFDSWIFSSWKFSSWKKYVESKYRYKANRYKPIFFTVSSSKIRYKAEIAKTEIVAKHSYPWQLIITMFGN